VKLDAYVFTKYINWAGANEYVVASAATTYDYLKVYRRVVSSLATITIGKCVKQSYTLIS